MIDINKQLSGYEGTFKPIGMASNVFWDLVEVIKLDEIRHQLPSKEEIAKLRKKVGAL